MAKPIGHRLSHRYGRKVRSQRSTLVWERALVDGSFNGLQDDVTGIVSFRGVRYANNPTGNLRWREPVSPPTVQLGSVDATQFRSSCIDGGQTSVPSSESEDCLFGNIYVPSSAATTDKLPVMIWFHGGGLQSGNGQAPAQFLVNSSESPMIFVAFNYRLAQFGFLGGTEGKSQLCSIYFVLISYAAIKWVNKYISEFGGDPAKVTIFGESAGGGSVMFQLVGHSGNNSNLFRGAIGDSPSLSFTPAYNDPYIESIYSDFASNAGCGSASDRLACLRAANVNTLAAAGPKTISVRPAIIYVFAPVVGGIFLFEPPVEALLNGNFAHVPVLFGSNTDEGANWSGGVKDPAANTNTAGANETTVFNFLKGQYNRLDEATFDQLAALYTDFKSSAGLEAQQMYGEARYICTANLIAGASQGHGQSSVYQYRYNNPATGSTHGAELTAFFSSTPSDSPNSDLFLSMRQYWTSFVTSGTPVSDTSGVVWNSVTENTGQAHLLLQPGAVGMERYPAATVTRCQTWHALAGKIGT
ncbi:alpha/beta-hydrolase [Mycena floridula]|nr:alpha/beta-hydrolase [Mycena floridula]